MPKLSQKTEDKIQSLYVQGYEIEGIAGELNVSYTAVYNRTRLRERGFDSQSDYLDHLAEQKGYDSYQARKKDMHAKRQRKRLNRKLGKILREGVRQRKKNYSWLAKQVGVSHTAIYLYVHGKSLPSPPVFRRMCSVLKLRYKTLDDIVKAA